MLINKQIIIFTKSNLVMKIKLDFNYVILSLGRGTISVTLLIKGIA